MIALQPYPISWEAGAPILVRVALAPTEIDFVLTCEEVGSVECGNH